MTYTTEQIAELFPDLMSIGDATLRDRVAAGCTPSIDEANCQEYSSYVWAAIRGANRVGGV